MQSLQRTLRGSLHQPHQLLLRPLQLRHLVTHSNSKLNDKDESDTLPRLSRPIGLPHPPQPGENMGVDNRTWAQRREQFTNWDRHLEKREKMTKELLKPYFRDFSELSVKHKGKSFLSPALLFRSDKSLFFPNLVGRTLQRPSNPLQNTTDVLEGRVSVVAMFSSTWAEAQARTFTDGLVVGDDGGGGGGDCTVQRVDVNVEQNPLKAWLVRAFMPNIRKKFPAEQHGRYFLVSRGLEEEMRGHMGYMNSKVGYVYLLDWNCRIRWAGSGRATEEEKVVLRRGVEKLKEEWKRLEAEKAVKGKKERGGKVEKVLVRTRSLEV